MKTRYQAAILQGSQVLLIRHHEFASGREYWVIPGGGREVSDQSEEQAVAREAFEETGLKVSVERLLFSQPVELMPGYERVYQEHKTYLCRILGGTAAPGYEPEPEASNHYEINAVAWFDLNDPASWGEAGNDPITGPLLRRIRENIPG